MNEKWTNERIEYLESQLREAEKEITLLRAENTKLRVALTKRPRKYT